MGANAGTAVPVYASGQVLTAANLNLTNCGVPVFGGTATRDAAFGGSGEKVLAEGQLCYVEDLTGVAQIQYYDGASWISLTSGGMVRVGGSSFSAVGSVAYDGVFTATYRNYVIIGNVLVSTGNPAFGFQLTSAGTPDTADYLYQTVRGDSTSITGARSITQSSAQVINSLDATHYGAFTLTLYNPAVAIRTAYTNVSTRLSTSTTAVEVVTYGGGHNDAGAFDGIDFLPASGNITGVINIYGVTDS